MSTLSGKLRARATTMHISDDLLLRDAADLIDDLEDRVRVLEAVRKAASWISLCDMGPEDHKSHRKFQRLREALAAAEANDGDETGQ